MKVRIEFIGRHMLSSYTCPQSEFVIYDVEANLQGNRNSVNVEGATHKQVVDLIKSGGDCLTLTVISVTQQEAERLEPCDDGPGYSYVDYSEKRSLPISIPDYQCVDRAAQKYVAFNIYMAGRHLCSRRYREFSNLHAQLKKEFAGFNFPKLPGKWPFALSEQQLDARRRGLEQYLEKVCAVRVIAESDPIQEFLTDSEDSITASPVDLKILLPDREVVTVSVKKSTNAEDVYRAVVDKIGLSKAVAKYFYLFEIIEYNFERKLQPDECPHALYIQNYSTASSSCLTVRKWLFNLAIEAEMLRNDAQAASFVFWQAVEEVNRGTCAAGERLYQLKALQDLSRCSEYLALARTLPGYGRAHLPPCHTDSRKEGKLVPTVGFSSLALVACRPDGSPEVSGHVLELFPQTWDTDPVAGCLRVHCKRPDRPQRCLNIYTPYFQYLSDCLDRIAEEAKWVDTGE